MFQRTTEQNKKCRNYNEGYILKIACAVLFTSYSISNTCSIFKWFWYEFLMNMNICNFVVNVKRRIVLCHINIVPSPFYAVWQGQKICGLMLRQDQHTRLSCAYCQEEQPVYLQLLEVREAAAVRWFVVFSELGISTIRPVSFWMAAISGESQEHPRPSIAEFAEQ